MWKIYLVDWNNHFVTVLFLTIVIPTQLFVSLKCFYYLSTLLLLNFILIFGYRLKQHWGSNSATVWCRYRVYICLLEYRNYYFIHGSPQTSTHVLIEVQYKMAKNSHMALCCQNWVSKGNYGLPVVPLALLIVPPLLC